MSSAFQPSAQPDAVPLQEELVELEAAPAKTAPQPTSSPSDSFSDLLTAVLGATQRAAPEEKSRAAAAAGALQGLDHPDVEERVRWLLEGPMKSQVRARLEAGRRLEKGEICRFLGGLIARIDALATRQVNAIIHHPRFQQLEAAWLSLWHLTNQVSDALENTEAPYPLKIKVRVLSVSKREMQRDFDRATEFDQSEIFRKVYGEEFDTSGGSPYGVLLGDYQFANSIEDIELLQHLSQVAAAAFCPFVSAASPKLLGLGSYQLLEQPIDLAGVFQTPEYIKWRALRESDDARFLGLTAPSILMRRPHTADDGRVDGFIFREDTSKPDASEHLWGNAAFAFGSVLVQAFASCSWFAEIRGVNRGSLDGGLVAELPIASHVTDRAGVAPKMPTSVAITETREQELASLGFIPLCRCADTPYAAFYSNQSVHKPKVYSDGIATVNARISAMLQYMMCVSRFSHYVKMLGRDKIGSYASETELEDQLNRWISQYVSPDEKASAAVRSRYPLREAKVEVRPVPGSPGSYRMTMHLLPHFQPDTVTVALRLVTRLASQDR